MDLKLFGQALAKFLLGAVLVGVLIFLPAGTLRYPQGWLLMLLLFLIYMTRTPARCIPPEQWAKIWRF